MKHLISVLSLVLIAVNSYAETGARPAMSNRIMAAPNRYTASLNQINSLTLSTTPVKSDTTSANTNGTELTAVATTVAKDMRDAEKNACINNNIGVGNTFVWASRYSDTSNYASMVEDIETPENNVCFVRVELKSDDESRISVADFGPKYFVWGQEIECGSWANRNELEKRILDAKKGNRVAGIVASSVGGAGLGVGIMELFGNRLIGGRVEGQKDMSGPVLLKSQLLTLKEKGQMQDYNDYVTSLKIIKKACDATSNNVDGFDCVEYSSLLAEFAK